MKILNLVLYSDNDEIYVQMYEALSRYYKGFSDVSTYFYKYDENISGNIEITGDIINIKGRESYMPGILNKTIDAFMLFKNNGEYEKYDYIIRSNISSIVNFSLLSEQLELNPVEYYGSTNIGNIKMGKKNVPFASGTNIIMSKKGYMTLVDNINLLNRALIDDLSIALFFHRLNIKITNVGKAGENGIAFVSMLKDDLEYKKLVRDKYLVYRNRSEDNRQYDVINMRNIIKYLTSHLYIAEDTSNYTNIDM
jgi:hypothetical protein